MIAKSIREVDVIKRVDELLISQYKESTNLQEYIKAFVKPVQPIFNALADTIDSRSIDKASGYSLDKVGKTVGEFRVIAGGAASPYFGFKDNAQALGLSVGQFFSYGDKTSGDLILNDSDFRSVIRSRIQLNTSSGKIEDMIRYYDLLTLGAMSGETLNTRISQGNLSLDVFFDNVVPIPAKLLLSLRANRIIPAGIGFSMRDRDGNIEVVQL